MRHKVYGVGLGIKPKVLYALCGCVNLRLEARPREPVAWLERTHWCRNTFEMMRLVELDDLCLLSDQLLVLPALRSPRCTSISPFGTFFLWPTASASLHLPLLSFHRSASVSLFLFLFFSRCVFAYFSWQVNRWFWAQWRCTFSPLSPSESLFLAQQFIGVALLRRCVKCYSISPSLHHTIWMWD